MLALGKPRDPLRAKTSKYDFVKVRVWLSGKPAEQTTTPPLPSAARETKGDRSEDDDDDD